LDDDGAGYLISVSDVMSGLLFVFIITLMAYVLNIHLQTERKKVETTHLKREVERKRLEKQRLVIETQNALREKRSADDEKRKAESAKRKAEREKNRMSAVVENLTNAKALRKAMLLRIRRKLARRGIRVEVDKDHGILHLTGKALRFESSKATLPPGEEGKLKKIGGVLAEVLPCYVAQPAPPPRCDPRYRGKLESVFVEGHTDNFPYRGGAFADNWDLSAQRAMYTYRAVVEQMYRQLAELKNTEDFPIFSVTGYGEGRPVVRHLKPTHDAANRRIDLRFIMTPPMTPPRADVAPVRELRERGL